MYCFEVDIKEQITGERV